MWAYLGAFTAAALAGAAKLSENSDKISDKLRDTNILRAMSNEFNATKEVKVELYN